MVQETDREAERQTSWRGDGRDGTEVEHGPKRASIAPPIEDLKMLEDWLANSSEPLLLLAPFGSGKSVLLATFACHLAEAVVHWCDNPGDEPLPPVPLPVRLRAWDWYAREKFRAYVCGRSQDILDPNGAAVLTADHVEMLASAGKLLPLYDGFDELADAHDVRSVALDGMRRLTARFVLSARPGHGAEAKFDSNQVYSLRELTVTDAEEFICQRLDIPAGHDQHHVLVVYRKAQPHINSLFRRPLFLNAWCSAYPNDPPDTLAKLMNVVLKKVFDERVFQNESHLSVGSANELVLSCHVSGAILAAYAEQGFGQVCNLMQKALRDAFDGSECFANPAEIAQWHALAVRAGLLIPAGDGHYTFKTPVVEYLIGSFYARLVQPSIDESDDTKDKRRRQRFVRKFRQGFWWFEFDDIWLYAFDQLWRGSPAQVNMANDVVVWLLDYSRRCMDAGQYSGELLPEQTDQDRHPFTCHRFAIRALLPIGPVSAAVDRRVKKLLEAGIEQLFKELLQNWRHFPGIGDDLDLLAARRPVELIRYLEPALAAKSHKDVWSQVASAIRTVLEHLEPAHVKELVSETLVPCLANVNYKEAWDSIAYAIGAGFRCLELAYVKELVSKTLLPCLANAEYKEALLAIDDAIGVGLSCLEPAYVMELVSETLLPCLANADYKEVSWAIAGAIGAGISCLEPVYVKEVVDTSLVPCLVKADYKQAWDSIAGAIGAGFRCLEPVYVKEVVDTSLVPCLAKADYKQAWDSIAQAIGAGFRCLEPVYVKEVVDTSLVPCLAKADYKQAWRSIARAIGAGISCLEPVYVKEVVEHVPCAMLGQIGLQASLG